MCYVTLSLGIAQIQPPLKEDLPPESLFRIADTALYQAKNQGRNRAVLSEITAMD